MRTIRLTLVSLLALGVVAGCSSTESGEPVAGDGTATEATDEPTDEPTQASETSSSEEPDSTRPKDLDLTKVDICKVVGTLPLTSYGMDAGHPPLAGESSLFPGSKDCFTESIARNLSLSVVAVVGEGFDSYVSSVTTEVTKGTAAGYPSAVVKGPNPSICFAVVDVHDDQMVYVAYGMANPSGKPVTPAATLCQKAPTIAAAVTSAIG